MKDTQKIKAFVEMAKFPFHPSALTRFVFYFYFYSLFICYFINFLIFSAKERHKKYKIEVEARVAEQEYGYFADRFGDFGGI